MKRKAEISAEHSKDKKRPKTEELKSEETIENQLNDSVTPLWRKSYSEQLTVINTNYCNSFNIDLCRCY